MQDILSSRSFEARAVTKPNLSEAYQSVVRRTIIAPRHETSKLNVADVQKILSPDGKWKPKVSFGGQDPYAISPVAIMEKFDPINRDVYKVVDASLNEERDITVFHRHDIAHIDRIAERGVALVRSTHMDEPTTEMAERLVAYMAVAHDWANFIDRKNHSQYSAQLLALSAPELQENPTYWKIIERAIELHDSSTDLVSVRAEHFFNYWIGNDATKSAFSLSASDKELADNPLFRVAFCSFYLADKLDFGKQRVSQAVNTPEKLLADQHNLADAFGQTKSVFPTKDNDVIWEIAFQPQFSEEERKQYGLQNEEGLRTDFVPPTLDDWSQLFFSLQKQRVPAKAVFALIPDTKRFAISLVNEDAQQEGVLDESTIREYIYDRSSPDTPETKPLEIERKWLVAKQPENLATYPHELYLQVYADDGRYRRKTTEAGQVSYIRTVKTGSGLVRGEVNESVSQEAFDQAHASSNRVIEKTRYQMPFGGKVIELDVYEGTLAGHMSAEVEFKTIYGSNKYQIPAWFGKEVTEDKRYSNGSLSSFGWPTE